MPNTNSNEAWDSQVANAGQPSPPELAVVQQDENGFVYEVTLPTAQPRSDVASAIGV